MPNKVTLIRPDGTRLDATPDQASKLKLLGYAEETPEARSAVNVETAREEFYTSPGQKVATVAEGLGRGATLGATDYLLGDEHTAARAKYNPGTAIASEALGTIGPLLIPGAQEGAAAKGAGLVARLAERTPTAMLARGAEKAAVAVGAESAVARAVTKGAIEGAGFGAAATADHAFLNGDPLTSESVLHGMGWGALFGGGLSAIGAGLSKVAPKAAEPAAGVPGALREVGEATYSSLRKEVGRLNTKIKDAVKTTDSLMAGSAKNILKLGAEAGLPRAELAALRNKMTSAQSAFSKALKKNDIRRMEAAQTQWEGAVNAANERMGVTKVAGAPSASLSELKTLKVVQRELGSFPANVNLFAKMNEKRAERMFATMDQASKLSSFPVLGKAVDDAANKLAEALGVEQKGVAGLRATWQAARQTLKAETASKAESSGFVGRAVGSAAGVKVAKKVREMTGSPLAGYAAFTGARHTVAGILSATLGGLVGLRAATLGRLEQAARSFAPKAGKAAMAAGPRAHPLAVRLDGSVDSSTKDPQALAQARLKDIADASGHVQDTLFRGVEPLSVSQPTLGPGLHKAAVGAFQALRAMMPADPGVVSGLKTIWKPSQLQAAVIGKQYEVFHNPVTVAERMLNTGQFDAIQIKAMKEIAPSVFQHLRVALLEKVTMPGFLDEMPINEQRGLGIMLDIPIHSSMRPGFIASAQQLHTDRSQPLPTPAIPGSTNGGRPGGAAETPGATKAQITESR